MLSCEIGPGFSSLTRSIRPGGDYRHVPAAVLGLKRELERKDADITFAWGLAALAAAVIAGRRRIFFSPDGFAGPRAIRWIRALMSRGNVVMICPTHTQHRVAISRGIDPARCRVIPPGVDFGKIQRRPDATAHASLRFKLGLAEKDFVLIAPGESTLQTAHDQAVWTTGILHVLDSSYKLLIWGRGSRAIATAELGNRLKQPELVKMAEKPASGQQYDFASLLPIADACLVTAGGTAPTLPIATAMAAGVPIISTVTYTHSELLEDRHTALMVPRRSPRALAQRVLDLRQDPALAAKLTDTARAEAYEHFSMMRMLEKYREEMMSAACRVQNEEVPQTL